MTKILIADNNTLIRRRIKKIIENTSDMTVGDEASHGTEAITKALEDHFNVVLLDISLPGVSGLDVLTMLKAQKPDLPILMLSIYEEREYMNQAFEKGASGFLTKKNAFKELVGAIWMVSAGEKYINSAFVK